MCACKECEGYYGSLRCDGRSNHRIIPLKLNGEDWFFQYSPYVYYNEHCIVLKGEHVPMKTCRKTFIRLLEFVEQFPHYFLGSNADLPIVEDRSCPTTIFKVGIMTLPWPMRELFKAFS